MANFIPPRARPKKGRISTAESISTFIPVTPKSEDLENLRGQKKFINLEQPIVADKGQRLTQQLPEKIPELVPTFSNRL